MKIYLAIGGNQKVFDFVLKHDLGWCMAPDNARNPKGRPYFLDNGAFKAWKDGTNWEEVKFKGLINRYPDYDFFVYPDIVGGGPKSLYKSLNYVGTIPGKGYLAVQEGMLANNVMEYVDAFDGLFIEMGYEDQEGKCFVVGHEFEVTEDGSKKIVSSKSSGSPSGAEPLDKIVKKKE